MTDVLKQTGIYLITHVPTGRKYVGSTSVSFKHRWMTHIRHLCANKHHSPYLQNTWNKYGVEQFRFRVECVCSKEDCIVVEQHYIDKLKPEFNTSPVAGSTLGTKRGEKTKNLIREKAMCRAKKHLVNGEWLTIRQISERSGVSKGALMARIRRGETGDALAAPPRLPDQNCAKSEYLVRGEWLDVPTIEKRYNINRNVIYFRIKNGRSGDELIAPLIDRKAPNPTRAKRYLVRGENLTALEIAEKYDLTAVTVRHRARIGLRGEDLIAPHGTPYPRR